MHLVLQPIFVRLVYYSKSRFSPNKMAVTTAVSNGREPMCQGPVTHGGAVTDTNSIQRLYSKETSSSSLREARERGHSEEGREGGAEGALLSRYPHPVTSLTGLPIRQQGLGLTVFTGKVEMQVEILSHWRYVDNHWRMRHETQELTGSEIVSREIDRAIYSSAHKG